jgi:hypothetical protein
MNDQRTRGGDTSWSPDPEGAQERDLNFLRPLINKIIAVEFKLQGDSAGRTPPAAVDAKAAPGVEARLDALERDVAAIIQRLQVAPSPEASGDQWVSAPMVLLPGSWRHTVLAAATTIVLLLIAHWLVVFMYDLRTPVLRVVSVAIPLSVAMVATLRYRITLSIELVVAILVGLLAVSGMSYVTSLYQHDKFLPENLRELREVLEYMSSIAFAHLAGALASSALQARFGARNPAGDATLKVARLLASALGKAATTAGEVRAQVDRIHSAITGLLAVISAIAALIAGLRSVLG